MDYSLLIGIHDEKQSLTKANVSDDASDDQGSPSAYRDGRALSTSDGEHGLGAGGDRTDSDQEDNFSPAEDLDDAEDANLNRD
jgi:hypothetical protein